MTVRVLLAMDEEVSSATTVQAGLKVLSLALYTIHII
jgi:hypothetical protein